MAAGLLNGQRSGPESAASLGVPSARTRASSFPLLGYGLAADYDIERKFRETRLYQIAPISTNLILSYVAEHMLGLPRSF
jgi:alkylation response protein AidB-like acyl-CoA dehydrogenase